MAILSNINDKFRVDSAGAVYFGTSAGTNGQILKSIGTGGSPVWIDQTDITGPFVLKAGDTMTGPLVINGSNSLTVGGHFNANSTTTLGGAVTIEGNLFMDDYNITSVNELDFGFTSGYIRGSGTTVNFNGLSATFGGTVTGGDGAFTNLTINAGEKLRFDGAGGHTFIQEVSNDNLILATGGTTRLTIDNSGIVQINTNVAKTSTSTAEFGSFGQSNEATNYSTLQMYTKGGASQADRKVVFQTIEAGVANAGSIVLQPSGGNVGIGTDTPDELLHLYKASGNAGLEIEAVSAGDPLVRFVSANNRTGNLYYTDGTTLARFAYDHADIAFKMFAHNNASVDFYLSETKAYFTQQDVGIGTDTPNNYTYGSNLAIKDTGSVGITIQSNTTGTSAIQFADGDSGTAQYRGGIDYYHSGHANASTMVFRTNGGERLRITSGGQLQLQGSSSSLAKSTTQTEWAYIPGNTPGASLMAQNPSGMSSASAGYHIVYGANNSSPYQAFIDVITYQCGSSTNVTVISSTTLNNSPGSRSYSKNSNAVFLNISGAVNYNCNIKTTFINFPH